MLKNRAWVLIADENGEEEGLMVRGSNLAISAGAMGIILAHQWTLPCYAGATFQHVGSGRLLVFREDGYEFVERGAGGGSTPARTKRGGSLPARTERGRSLPARTERDGSA